MQSLRTPGPKNGEAISPPLRRRPRTQAQRRHETRTALLEATIASLVTYGYANTSTSRIAELAGVSRGAVTPYFRSRPEMFGAAVSHLAKERFASAQARFSNGGVSLDEALDVLWEEIQGPVFQALLELWVASRTDPELKEVMLKIAVEIAQGIAGAAGLATADVARHPEFVDEMYFTVATIAGLALFKIGTGAQLDRIWVEARQRLAAALARLSD